MEIEFLFVLVIAYLRSVVCTGEAACISKEAHPVAKGCVDNEVVLNMASYLDTGTGPKYENLSCRCLLSPINGRSSVRFDAETEITYFKHRVQVKDVELNGTVTEASVIIDSNTDLWLTTDGIGGVCISVSANPNVSITCYSPNRNMYTESTQTTVTTVSTFSDAKLENGVTINIRTYSPRRPSDGNQQEITGPVVGGLLGLLLLISTVILVVYLLRRRSTLSHYEDFIRSEPAGSVNVEHEYTGVVSPVQGFVNINLDYTQTDKTNSYYNTSIDGNISLEHNLGSGDFEHQYYNTGHA